MPLMPKLMLKLVAKGFGDHHVRSGRLVIQRVRSGLHRKFCALADRAVRTREYQHRTYEVAAASSNPQSDQTLDTTLNGDSDKAKRDRRA